MSISLHGGLKVGEGSLHGVANVKEASLGGGIHGSSMIAISKWGKIKGNIEDQEDLMSLFNALSVVARTGLIDDLIQEPDTYLLLDCGSSTTVIGD